MRIVQIINHFGLDRGGAERLARRMHEDLLDRGLDAWIVALEPCDTEGLANSLSLDLTNPRDPRALWRLDRALRAILRPGDVVHAHLFPSTMHVSALRQLGRIQCPVLMTEHNTWNRRRESLAGRSLDRVVYRGFDGIVGISEGTRDALLDLYPSLTPKAHIVENGIALRHAQMPPRADHGGPLRIVSVGRLTHTKNLATGIDALALLGRDDWSYTIVGDGPERQALEAAARARGIGGKVHFTGRVDDAFPELERADLLLMPSRWEGFGLAAVEAMNCGLPLVVSDVPGLREVAGEAALPPIPLDRPDLFAAAIATLLGDPALRKELGQTAFRRSLRFDRQRMLDGYLARWEAAGASAA